MLTPGARVQIWYDAGPRSPFHGVVGTFIRMRRSGTCVVKLDKELVSQNGNRHNYWYDEQKFIQEYVSIEPSEEVEL